jgi:hypothetical protein
VEGSISLILVSALNLYVSCGPQRLRTTVSSVYTILQVYGKFLSCTPLYWMYCSLCIKWSSVCGVAEEPSTGQFVSFCFVRSSPCCWLHLRGGRGVIAWESVTCCLFCSARLISPSPQCHVFLSWRDLACILLLELDESPDLWKYALMMEASQTSVNFYKILRHYNREDSHLYIRRRENIKYNKIRLFLSLR